jgi:hypothetical protein
MSLSNRAIDGHRQWLAAVLLCCAQAAWGAPAIESFEADPLPSEPGTPVLFMLVVSAPESGEVELTLDADGDGQPEHRVLVVDGEMVELEHAYPEAGRYRAQARVSDGSAAAEQELLVTVDTPAQLLGFTAEPNPVSAGEPVALSWQVEDPDGDPCTCTLFTPGADDDDSEFLWTEIEDCARNNTLVVVFPTPGLWSPTLSLLGALDPMSTATVELEVTAQQTTAAKLGDGAAGGEGTTEADEGPPGLGHGSGKRAPRDGSSGRAARDPLVQRHSRPRACGGLVDLHLVGPRSRRGQGYL